MTLLTKGAIEARPWGSFERFTENETTTVKIISVNPNQRLSLQTHKLRSEFWKIISGSGVVTISGVEHAAKAGNSFDIPVEVEHRVSAGSEGLVFLEIAFGAFDENDIVRLEDDFGRST